uniref:Uncharacterized protein n=1 Tax=Trieres chinensis TaxID=1514140 RepID=A0A7S1ZTZ5_TRICV
MTNGSADESAGGLNFYNYLNVVAYVANLFFVNIIMLFDKVDLKSNADVSAKYQTIVTPVGWAFSIWGIIFAAQALFTVVQLLPTFRSLPQVQQGVKYWYALVSAFQIVWTFVFACEMIWISCVVMVFILSSLCALLQSQSRAASDNTRKEFWLLRFPFQIHAGWIIAATVVNINLVLVASDVSPVIQAMVAALSLVAILCIALSALVFPTSTNVVIPVTLAWGAGGIWAELNAPKQSILDKFSNHTINVFKIGAACICLILLFAVLIKVISDWREKRHEIGRENEEGVHLAADLEDAYT